MLTLFLLCSCGTQVTMTSRGCRNIQLLTQQNLNNLPQQSSKIFRFKHVVWNGGLFRFHKSLSLKRVFNDHDIHCEDVKAIHYSFHDKWQDILMALIPFINRQSLSIEGLYR